MLAHDWVKLRAAVTWLYNGINTEEHKQAMLLFEVVLSLIRPTFVYNSL